nr:MAG TPA: hypothetical protein [Bacteriophage sp.]
MAEKQDIREDQMTSVDSVDYVRGLKGKDSVLIAPDKLPHPNTGGGYIIGPIYRGKWYRIAIGVVDAKPSSGIFNVVNNYNNTPSKSILFYAFAEGYDNGAYIVELGSSPKKSIYKARILYVRSSGKKIYLDVYTNIPGEYNDFIISAACLIGFSLQEPEEVGEAIPEGYSVKEFTL